MGKTIKWSASAYSANHDYEGVAKILSIDFSKNNPIVSESISGDNLNDAFIDNDDVVYSDPSRGVNFEVYEN